MTGTHTEDRTEVLGRRIGAALVDLLLLFVLGLVLGLLIGDTETGGGSASVRLEGAEALVWVALALAYYGVSEAARGQTLGKRLLSVRVARLNGEPPSSGQIAVRTLLRLVDGIVFYLVGLIAVLATGQRRQRLGDLAAKTTVVSAGGR